TFQVVVDPKQAAYKVTVYLGEQASAHDRMEVYAEGALKAVVSTPKGVQVARTFIVPAAALGADGILDIRIRDMSNHNPTFAIAGLDVVAADLPRFNIGSVVSRAIPTFPSKNGTSSGSSQNTAAALDSLFTGLTHTDSTTSALDSLF